MAATSGRAGITRAALLRTIESVYRGPAWHGPSVRQALRGLTEPLASARLAPGRPTIRETILHLAYTRHVLRARLTGIRAGRFERPRPRPWWPAVSGSLALADDVGLLDREHERLIAEIRAAPAGRLDVVRPGRRETLGDQLVGLALHDAYHAGQIGLLRRVLTRS